MVRNNWKILALLALMACAGCKRYEHKNVIQDIVKTNDKVAFLLNDAETGDERIYTVYFNQGYFLDFDYLRPGDTVKLILGKMRNDEYYQKNRMLAPRVVTMEYNQDTIIARKEREKYNLLRQEFFNSQSK